MPYSEAKIAAYKQMDEAVENLIRTYFEEDGDSPGINLGWLLVTQQMLPEQSDNPGYDSEDFTHSMGSYMKRGMNPVLGLGMAHDWIRHFCSLQERDDE